MGFWSIIGNLLWLILGPGILCFLFWVGFGVVMAITVVGLPFAFACFRIAIFSLLPFGLKLVDAEEVGEERILGTTLFAVIWVLLAGFWLALFHMLAGVLWFLTIVGFPFGLAHFNLAKVSLNPLGKRAVPAA